MEYLTEYAKVTPQVIDAFFNSTLNLNSVGILWTIYNHVCMYVQKLIFTNNIFVTPAGHPVRMYRAT